MKNIFGTVRYQRLNNNIDLGTINLNGNYTPSFYLNNAFSDRVKQNIITNLYDMAIPEEKYTGTLPVFSEDGNPTAETFPVLDRLFYISYNDKINPIYGITEEYIENQIEQVLGQFSGDVMEIEKIINFVKMFTNLEEVETGKFLLSENTIDNKKQYLNIREYGDVITNE